MWFLCFFVAQLSRHGKLFKRISFDRTLTFAILDLVAPVRFLILGVVLSGFTR